MMRFGPQRNTRRQNQRNTRRQKSDDIAQYRVPKQTNTRHLPKLSIRLLAHEERLAHKGLPGIRGTNGAACACLPQEQPPPSLVFHLIFITSITSVPAVLTGGRYSVFDGVPDSRCRFALQSRSRGAMTNGSTTKA